MKKLIISLLLLAGCSTHSKKPTDQQIDQHCQDLNVLFQKGDAIASNIANAQVTRTAAGGPYKRLIAKNCKQGICEITADGSSPMLKYEPKNADADKNGYVAYPNINLQEEMADNIIWSRAYETVIANAPVGKSFFFKNPKAKHCFDKYPAVKERLDLSEYLGHH